MLQTVPPSCINRDDTGSPKTAIYGGVTRARVSSQAWKHAMRQAFVEESLLDEEDVGKRTKKVTELVEKEIAALAPDMDAATYPGNSGEPYNSSNFDVLGRAYYLEARWNFGKSAD